MNRVVFFGDSICYGEKVSPHKTFVVRLSEEVEKEFGGRFYVDNPSVSGNTTRMALERMPQAVQKLGLSLMVLQFGLNDCNFWETDRGLPRVSPEAFRCNLHEIIDRARNFGAVKIILNTNHPTSRTKNFDYCQRRYEDGNLAYNEIIRRVAGERDDCVLVDMEMSFREYLDSDQSLRLEDLLLDDQLHLSCIGHEVYFRTLKPVLMEELRKLDGKNAC